MPFKINIGQPVVGYALSSARRGENVKVVYREFTSTEDGQYFIERLESLPACFIDELPYPVRRSQVDNLLAILRCDGKAVVYLNELNLDVLVRARGRVDQGQEVSKDNIADVERMVLSVDIPDDAGFICLFSIGWRKGLFYDYGPLHPDRGPRQYDPSVALGQAVSHVLFQERFKITNDEWESLFGQLWFPFVGLSNQTIAGLLNHVRSGWNCDDMLDDIAAEVKDSSPKMVQWWRTHPTLSKHIVFLERAVDRFLHDDFISCTSILFPRIEGIVRTYHADLSRAGNPGQKDIADLAVSAKVANNRSLLLPFRFKAYLEDVYFANFNLPKDDVPLSRHSVGHGVAKPADFNQKSAIIAILIVNQLFYSLGAEQPID